jgi:hypothetical protein
MVLNLEKVIDLSDLDVNADVVMFEGAAAPPPQGFDSPQVIRVDQSTTFTFNWTTSGALLPWFNGSQLKFDIFYEMMGPGEATFPVPSTTTTLDALTVDLIVPANVVDSGVYRVVARMMMLPPVPCGSSGPSPTTPTKICGFAELGLVEYYTI